MLVDGKRAKRSTQRQQMVMPDYHLQSNYITGFKSVLDITELWRVAIQVILYRRNTFNTTLLPSYTK